MKTLTFKGFLKSYNKSLSTNKTSNIKKLAKEVENGNIRLKEPLLLLSMFDDSSSKALSKNKIYDEYDELKKQYSKVDFLIEDIANENSTIPNDYKKVYRSYLSVKDRHKRDDNTKQLMKRKIKSLQQQKAISDYHINKELNINPGNFSSFMKHDKLDKISLKNTRKILDYLQKK